MTESIGAVVIGRNEGDRLRICLESVATQFSRLVYVDSGSSDGSVALARAMGVDTVELTPDLPYTAARARNAGMAWLRSVGPETGFVQFVDGDCELDVGWLAAAQTAMAREPEVAIVCGRRRERFPEASVYNHLCDREWATTVGAVTTCGGDAFVRVEPFVRAGGFTPTLIAGEEPDLCHRIRAQGWTILRIDAEMTRHDAALTRASQWWNRNKRSGYAYAEAWARRGSSDSAPRRRVLSNLIWASPAAWLFWPALWLQVYRRTDAAYATHIVLGKFPHCHGVLRFWVDHLQARRSRLIEYK